MTSPITISMICSIFKEYSSELEKGENSYRSGNVLSMTFNRDIQPHILKGEVSANSKQIKYSVDISLNLDEGIVQGQCSCPNEQSICDHMAALIIHAHYNTNINTVNTECKWKVCLEDGNESVKTITDIFLLEYATYKATKRTLTGGEINKFKTALGIESEMPSNNESSICPTTEFISIENTMDFVKEETIKNEVNVTVEQEQSNNSNLLNSTKKRKLPSLDMCISQRKCVYLYCNKTRRKNRNHHFFTFPVFKDRERCEKWLENCGNTNLLTIGDERLATLALCQDHFSDQSFYNYKKDRLIHSAVPLHYN